MTIRDGFAYGWVIAWLAFCVWLFPDGARAALGLYIEMAREVGLIQ